MKWHRVLDLVGNLALFDSSMLLAGEESPGEVRRQISRWVASGRLIQLRRGLYALAEPHARARPDVFAVAARIQRPSYVSLQSALAYHGVIPESVPVITSVTTGRPRRFRTRLGEFVYRHLQPRLFWGYEQVATNPGQPIYMAFPEKALLDLFHLSPVKIQRGFLTELRISPGQIDLARLQEIALRSAKPKLIRAASLTVRLLRAEAGEETTP
jgi:predicted transcriptional regulator of viral defense system